MGSLALLGISLNPLSYLASFIKDLFTSALNLFGEAASEVVGALLGFISTTSDPVFSGGWWSSSGEQVFVKVLAVAGTMMALALMLSVVTAMLASDHSILTKALIRLPIAAIEMALLTTVTAALLSATDEVSSYIASGTSQGLSEFVGAGMVASIVDTSVVGLVIGGLVILAGLAVWAQLLVRTALLYCAVMAGPLIFAAAVHPSASGLRKRYIEFGLSIILSKLVVALAFATASAMIGGVTSSASFAQAVGALLEALAILLIACFAPFILIRLIIGAEAIVVAEGLERRPLRAVVSGAQASYYARGLSSTFKQMGGSTKALSGEGGGTPPTGGSPPSGGGDDGSLGSSGPPSGGPPTPGSDGSDQVAGQSAHRNSSSDVGRVAAKKPESLGSTLQPASLSEASATSAVGLSDETSHPAMSDTTIADSSSAQDSMPTSGAGGSPTTPTPASPAESSETLAGASSGSAPMSGSPAMSPTGGPALESAQASSSSTPTGARRTSDNASMARTVAPVSALAAPALAAPNAPPPPRRSGAVTGATPQTGLHRAVGPSVPAPVSGAADVAGVPINNVPANNAPVANLLGRPSTNGRSNARNE